MSLTQEDLLLLSRIVKEAVDEAMRPFIGELKALRNDVHEIYDWKSVQDSRTNKLDGRVTRLESSVFGT